MEGRFSIYSMRAVCHFNWLHHRGGLDLESENLLIALETWFSLSWDLLIRTIFIPRFAN